MTEKLARLILGLVSAGLVAIALTTDLASLSGGRFWGDGATYHAMAWSLAEDLDLRYEAKDVFRSRREFSEGPQGIFLKRASGGLTFDAKDGFPWMRRVPEKEPRIYFAKPFVYPAVAAPLVRLFGTRGLLVTNALALSLALIAGYSMLRGNAEPGWALGASAALVLGTVRPSTCSGRRPRPSVWGWRRRASSPGGGSGRCSPRSCSASRPTGSPPTSSWRLRCAWSPWWRAAPPRGRSA